MLEVLTKSASPKGVAVGRWSQCHLQESEHRLGAGSRRCASRKAYRIVPFTRPHQYNGGPDFPKPSVVYAASCTAQVVVQEGQWFEIETFGNSLEALGTPLCCVTSFDGHVDAQAMSTGKRQDLPANVLHVLQVVV